MKSLVLCLMLALTCAGCSLFPAKAAAEANLKSWEVVGPAYVKYLDADESLNADRKAIRRRTVESATALAKKMVEVAR